MLHLTELYSKIIGKPIPSQHLIVCEMLDPVLSTSNRKLTESVSCYSYTLVLSGHIKILYDGKEDELGEGELFIFTPGMRIKTLDVSPDYSAYCLMADEKVTYEIPFARNIVAASYFPAGSERQNILWLDSKGSARLRKRMEELMEYTGLDHCYKKECLYSLYSLFILDLLNIQSSNKFRTGDSNQIIDLFLRFLKLANENFISHHDLRFYADKLAVTSIYLSRVVKRISGQTVKFHIDRLLEMEDSYLLLNTNYPIFRIGEMLNFATAAGFCKFFQRQKGISPKEYRLAKSS